MNKTIHIFDLDRTVICSDHRVKPCMNGNELDLQKYINEACKPELIEKDSLLPLAEYMKLLIAQGEFVAICTARHMANADYIFLRQNGLRVPLLMSRDRVKDFFPSNKVKTVYNSSDADYKGYYMDIIKAQFGDNCQYIIYDDHQGVLATAKEKGFYTVDAIVINKMLDSAYAEGFIDCEQESFAETESLIDSVITELALA